MQLTSKQRAFLRGRANGLEPVFQIGKGEIDENIVKSAAACLEKRELIKMKTLENSEYTSREAAEILAEKTGSAVVQVIGNIFILFKPKKKDSKFDLKNLTVL